MSKLCTICTYKYIIIYVHIYLFIFTCAQFYFLRFGLSLRESLLFDFGAMLMSRESFWVFGIDYLEQCTTMGHGAIELFISKMNIKNEKGALKLLNVLRGKGLIEAGIYYFSCSQDFIYICISK